MIDTKKKVKFYDDRDRGDKQVQEEISKLNPR